MFISQLVTGMLVSTVTAAFILLTKKLLHKQLGAKGHYHVWFLFMAALLLPLLPYGWLESYLSAAAFDAAIFQPADPGPAGDPDAAVKGNAYWLQNFTESVYPSAAPVLLNQIAVGVWLAGAAGLGLLTLHGWVRLHRMKRSFSRLEQADFLGLLERCKARLGISGEVTAVESPHVQSPMIFGVFRTYIVFPERFSEWLSEEECRYVLLHELSHYKSRDHLTNGWIIVLQLLYWFNPLVWAAFRRMRLDREVACDHAVLHLLEERAYSAYGDTILRMASRVSRRPVNTVWSSSFASPAGQLKARIQRIASFGSESTPQSWKIRLILLLAGSIVACQIPVAAALGVDGEKAYESNSGRMVQEDLSAYFGGYEGSFVLYDPEADVYHVHNEAGSRTRISPDSTYKIYSALFALDSGVIRSEASTIAWNGEQHAYAEWNKDQSLTTALQGSVSWYFRALDQRVGRERLQEYLDEMEYGNTDLSGGADRFWLESSLKISPLEQVRLLKNFYYNQSGFQEQHIRTVKDAMRISRSGAAVLSGKTGTGTVNNRDISGWFVGYVEKEGKVYFFAANLQRAEQANGSAALEAALSILRDKGIY